MSFHFEMVRNTGGMKARVIGFVIATLIRMVGVTLRFSVEDRAGIREKNPDHPLLWAFWHNRVFVMPFVYRKYLSKRKGYVLTSPSKDGELIAETMRQFGVGSVRGSSSRRGGVALRELQQVVERGDDACITPDGPRGPRQKMKLGLIKLAQLTDVPIFPVVVNFENAWELKTWDRFAIPKPFSKVHVILIPFQKVPSCPDTDPKVACQDIEDIMNQSLTAPSAGSEQCTEA